MGAPLIFLALLVATAAGACTESTTQCTSSLDCPAGNRCVEGVCQASMDGSPPDGSPDTGTADAGTMDTGTVDTGAMDTGVDTGSIDTGTADTGTADTGTSDTSPTDTGAADTGVDTGTPECTAGMYRTCPGPGGQYCLPSGMWSACLTADPTCTGAGGSYTGCRGTGCSVCTDLLTTYDCYFENHPSCVPNPTCAGLYYTCSPGCPAPTAADRCP